MSFHHKANQFLERMPAGTFDHVRESVTTAFGVAAGFKEKVEKIVADKRLSDTGHKEKIVDVLRGGPISHLKQLRRIAGERLKALEETRAKCQPVLDKSDMFAEVQRQEIRAWLRGMPEAERLRVAYETPDRMVREAIAFAIPALSGLNDEAKAFVVSAMIQDAHGERLAEINHLSEIYEAETLAIDEATADLRRASGLEQAAFSRVWETTAE